MVPVGIGLFLLEVVVKVVIEVVKTRFFIGQRVVGGQAVVVAYVEIIVAIISRADDKDGLPPPDFPEWSSFLKRQSIRQTTAGTEQRSAPQAADGWFKAG